jgi:hypothetical protein
MTTPTTRSSVIGPSPQTVHLVNACREATESVSTFDKSCFEAADELRSEITATPDAPGYVIELAKAFADALEVGTDLSLLLQLCDEWGL